jgi:hypothetical protein
VAVRDQLWDEAPADRAAGPATNTRIAFSFRVVVLETKTGAPL